MLQVNNGGVSVEASDLSLKNTLSSSSSQNVWMIDMVLKSSI